MAKPMKSKAMKAMKATKAMSAYSKVAEMVDLQPKHVEEIVGAMMALAAKQLNATGSFKLAGPLNMKLKKKPARQATEGVRPITKEHCVFKARKASHKLKITATKQLLLLIIYNDWVFSKCYVPIM